MGPGGMAAAGPMGIGLGVIGAGLSGGMGLFGQRKQYKNQKKLMGLQHQYQMALNQQGADLQYDMWNKTNYPAQIEMMRKAGLSPGLMYGLGGGGGTTTGSQGGGSATGGNAGGFNAMDISALKLGADLKLTEAMAKKTEAEANKISGVDTDVAKASISKMIQETTNLEAKNDLIKLEQIGLGFDNDLKKGTLNTNIKKASEELEALKLNNEFTRANWGNALALTANKALDAKMGAELKEGRNEREANLLEYTIKKICNDMEVDIQNANANTIRNVITDEIGKLNIKQNNKNAWIAAVSNVLTSLIGAGAKAIPTTTNVNKN